MPQSPITSNKTHNLAAFFDFLQFVLSISILGWLTVPITPITSAAKGNITYMAIDFGKEQQQPAYHNVKNNSHKIALPKFVCMIPTSRFLSERKNIIKQIVGIKLIKTSPISNMVPTVMVCSVRVIKAYSYVRCQLCLSFFRSIWLTKLNTIFSIIPHAPPSKINIKKCR